MKCAKVNAEIDTVIARRLASAKSSAETVRLLEIQAMMKAYNDEAPDDEQVTLRIVGNPDG